MAGATDEENVLEWSVEQVVKWSKDKNIGGDRNLVVNQFLRNHDIDGKSLLLLTEADLTVNYLSIGTRKNVLLAIRTLQRRCNYATLDFLGLLDNVGNQHHHHSVSRVQKLILDHHQHNNNIHLNHSDLVGGGSSGEIDRISPASSTVGGGGAGGGVGPLSATTSKPEVFKTVVSVAYAFLVTWITAFVMVVVHERVPDMKRYPPLPDIFLDNVPHIPWAFHMCEITGTVLFGIWVIVLVLHKHRIVLLRRFFALGGTVFLLRCVTMLITSLSVPGTHLQCTSSDHKISEDSAISLAEAISLRVQRAYTIWSGLGMSIQGVRTCGDYMFSGHTVSLTLLNFFITEYTPRRLYFLHTITWLLNMFGIFFILAAHEHYSIDVFVAFYISSRLFLYYHTLSNNHSLHMGHDSNRTRVWFPMFSYFESSVHGIIPSEYDSLGDVLRSCGSLAGEALWTLVSLKDLCMLTARRTNLELAIGRARLAAKGSLSGNGNNNDTTQRDLNRSSSNGKLVVGGDERAEKKKDF